MNTIVTILIAFVILIDFLRIEKKNKRLTYVYFTIVALAMLTSISNKYHFFAIGPFEIIINKMQPITDWVFNVFS